MANYLSNALKFSREDQAVEVRLAREDGRALVLVRDEGIGLPVAEQARVWNASTRRQARRCRVTRR